MRKTYLSKTKILSGAQCHKRLWLEIHRPDLKEETADMQQRFDAGNRVGEAARGPWPNGVLIGGDHKNLDAALRETQTQLAAHETVALFESTFSANGVLVRNDILERSHGKLRLVEVKSSTEVKDYHLLDATIQIWVLTEAGLKPDRVEIAYIDKNFVYGGDSDYQGLFAYEEVSEAVAEQLPSLPKLVRSLKTVAAGQQPDIGIGEHCHTPYECPFFSYCQPAQPEYPVSLLPRGGKEAEALLAEGFDDLRKVPKERLTKPNYLRVWKVTKSGKPELLPGAKQKLAELPYPRYYLDFETVQFAVPIWKDTRPYQKLPFQWSCHIESTDGSLKHQSFLDTSGLAPMKGFCESLLKCIGHKGPILVYNAAFEASVLEDLAKHFPKYAPQLRKLIARIVDLLPLTRENYYHPEMKGSWSLKAVLPTIAPELSYENLGEIQESGAAPAAYLEIINTNTPTERKATLIHDLQCYCERDTLATVELTRFLMGRRRPG